MALIHKRRFFYNLADFFMRVGLGYFFKHFKSIQAPQFEVGKPTIFASNHTAAFMDPLLMGAGQKPSIFFMTMASVFKTKLIHKFLSNFQMLPVYRPVDGRDYREKNEGVFKDCYDILNRGQNLLIFPESYTDEQFIRRVKPFKKGAVRIALGTLKDNQWQKDVFIQPMGINYTFPNAFRSDVLMAFDTPIRINDYKADFEKDENKTVNDLSQLVEQKVQGLITHVKEEADYPFFENLLRVSQKGMNHWNHIEEDDLLRRYEYTKNLAVKFNALDRDQSFADQKMKAEYYFKSIKAHGIEDVVLHDQAKAAFLKKLAPFILKSPLMLLGMIFNYVPYILVKRWVEKSFKRPVFWNAVKMVAGYFFMVFFHLIFLIPAGIYWGWEAVLLLWILMPALGVIAYENTDDFIWIRKYLKFKKLPLAEKKALIRQRTEILTYINQITA